MALDNTIGALLIAVIVASILYGVTCVQTWYYYIKYPSDSWYIKLLVFIVLISDSIHQALISHLIYTYAVTNFGVWAELDNLVWSLVVEVYFNGFTTFLVQCFLTWRIFTLSRRNWPLVISVMALVISEFALIFVYCGRGVHYTTFAQLHLLKRISMSVNATAVVADLYIAGLLCYYLQKSRTGFKKSDSLINKLVMFTINTGLLTSLDALTSLICISVWPRALIYLGFYFCIGRLYCNSLLATLNVRRILRGECHDSEDVEMSQSYVKKTNTTMGGTSGHIRNISIMIDTVQEHSIRDGQYSPSDDFRVKDLKALRADEI